MLQNPKIQINPILDYPYAAGNRHAVDPAKIIEVNEEYEQKFGKKLNRVVKLQNSKITKFRFFFKNRIFSVGTSLKSKMADKTAHQPWFV